MDVSRRLAALLTEPLTEQQDRLALALLLAQALFTQQQWVLLAMQGEYEKELRKLEEVQTQKQKQTV